VRRCARGGRGGRGGGGRAAARAWARTAPRAPAGPGSGARAHARAPAPLAPTRPRPPPSAEELFTGCVKHLQLLHDGGGCGGAPASASSRCGAAAPQHPPAPRRGLSVPVCITPGLRGGTTITLSGGLGPGGVAVVVREALHAVFRRVGDDLCAIAAVPLLVALTGGRVALRRLDGRPLEIALPEDAVAQHGAGTTRGGGGGRPGGARGAGHAARAASTPGGAARERRRSGSSRVHRPRRRPPVLPSPRRPSDHLPWGRHAPHLGPLAPRQPPRSAAGRVPRLPRRPVRRAAHGAAARARRVSGGAGGHMRPQRGVAPAARQGALAITAPAAGRVSYPLCAAPTLPPGPRRTPSRPRGGA
jgi:hypothetical protein